MPANIAQAPTNVSLTTINLIVSPVVLCWGGAAARVPGLLRQKELHCQHIRAGLTQIANRYNQSQKRIHVDADTFNKRYNRHIRLQDGVCPSLTLQDPAPGQSKHQGRERQLKKQNGMAEKFKNCSVPATEQVAEPLELYVDILTLDTMSIKLLSSLLVLASGISGRIITTTVSSSTVTATTCTTSLGASSKSSIPTIIYTRSLPAEVVVLLAVSTPVETVTPHEVTATDTVQDFTTTTVTDSAVTGVFSTTATIYETESTTSTDTFITTSTSTETTTASTSITVPTPTGWKTSTNTTGRTTRADGVIVDVQETLMQDTDFQQPLQDDVWSSFPPDNHGPPGREKPWPPGYKHPIPPGRGRKSPWSEKYPSSVDCKSLALGYKIRTDMTQTITSTSTIVPARVTKTESFSTTSTTTTTLTSSVTVVSSTTQLVTASTTITSYAACATDNILGPKVDKEDLFLVDLMTDASNPPDPGSSGQMVPANSAYDCCVRCLLSSQNCQYSVFFTNGGCGHLLNPTGSCPGQDFQAGKLKLVSEQSVNIAYGMAVSNGPCGKVVSPASQ
ncbi:MAG: hypothetical protein Q9211_003131 [Gyalolechia sp. 1 TL-2023]